MSSAPRWRQDAALATALLLAYNVYGHYSPRFAPANESIRLYAAQALVDYGQLALDPVLKAHGVRNVDKASYEGHSYLDKAPGATLLATPIYALGRALGASGERDTLHLWLEALTRLLVGLPCALAAVVLRRTIVGLGGSFAAGTLAALGVGLATPYALYATLFFGHGLAAALAAIAFHLAALIPPPRDAAGRQATGRALGAGAALGLMVLVETQTAALALGLLVLLGRRGGLRAALLGLAGAAPPALAQGVWNMAHFGSPLEFAYAHKADAALSAIHAQGLFGMTLPTATALFGLTLGAHRGLFFHGPVLLLAALGGRAARPALVLAAVHLAFISGFVDWPAGDSWAPRHLIPTIPLLGVGVGLALDRLSRPLPKVVWALAAGWGAAAAWLPSATFPYAPTAFSVPLTQLAVPLAAEGHWVSGAGVFGLFVVAISAAVSCAVALPAVSRRTAMAGSLAVALGFALPLTLRDRPAPDAAGLRVRAGIECLMDYAPCPPRARRANTHGAPTPKADKMPDTPPR